MNHCLDSWAVIAWMENNEPAASKVESIIRKRPFISTANVTEVYYLTKREHGLEAAQRTVDTLRVLTQFVPVDEDIAVVAGTIKADFKMSLGDAFCVATATIRNAKILTGDPEIIEANGKWKVTDLRDK